MKTFELSKNYNRLSDLTGKDKIPFRKLLSNGIYSPLLYIVPIDANTILSCKGFCIEHHQIFFEKITGKSYLVYRKKRLCRKQILSTSYYKVCSSSSFSPSSYIWLERTSRTCDLEHTALIRISYCDS